MNERSIAREMFFLFRSLTADDLIIRSFRVRPLSVEEIPP